jgi:integrase
MSEKRMVVWVQHFGDRPYLMLQWHDPVTGKRKSKSADTNNPIDAEQKRADLEYELNNGLFKEASGMSWERFRELFEEEHLAGLRAKTRLKYETVFTVFEEVVSPAKLRAVTERTVSRFVKGMRERTSKRGKVGMAPYSIKNYLIALKTALRWAVDQQPLPEVPKFPKVKVPKKKPQPIPAESFEKLLEKAPDVLWRAYLLCGWWGGLRLNEAHSLRWEGSEDLPWVDFQRNRIVLTAAFAKSDEDQGVPLHPVLRKALEELPRTGPKVFPFRSRRGGGPLTANGISNRILDMAKRAGVKLSMHRLRKGFGCRVAKQLGKGQAPILRELMRHSPMQITMDFYASVDDVLQEAISELT